MDRWLPIEGLQALLASILLLRVLLQPLFSVRRVLVFALLPTVVTPFVSTLHGLSLDYRVRWLGYRIFDWVCLTVVVYSLLDGFFRGLPGLQKVFRTVLTFAFIASFGAGICEVQYLGPRLGLVLSEAIHLDQIFVTTASWLRCCLLAWFCGAVCRLRRISRWSVPASRYILQQEAYCHDARTCSMASWPQTRRNSDDRLDNPAYVLDPVSFYWRRSRESTRAE